MQKKYSKEVILSTVGVIILIITIIGVSFAAFSFSKTGTKLNTITSGTITMSYSESTNGINLTNALPMNDTVGKALNGTNQYFDFTVTASITGSTTINYMISCTKESDSTLVDTAVKVYLTDMTSSADTQIVAPTKMSALAKTGSSEASGTPSGQYKLTSGTFTKSTTKKYRLRMWVADDYTGLSSAGTYKLRVNVYGKATT